VVAGRHLVQRAEAFDLGGVCGDDPPVGRPGVLAAGDPAASEPSEQGRPRHPDLAGEGGQPPLAGAEAALIGAVVVVQAGPQAQLADQVLDLAVACALAGARNFREAGDHAADLPQGVLARLGGVPHPLRRRIIAPSETRIRTLIQAIGADLLDDLTGGWLRALADAGRLDEALTAIAIDGKWLRGVLDGQVKLFAAMLHDRKVIIGQVRVPDDTTEATQVKELLRGVDLENAVVTADAAHSCRETAQYIAGKGEDGGREADYFLFVKGNAPSLQRAAFGAIQASGAGRAPDYTELDRSHGRVTRRSIWARPSHATETAYSTTSRYETQVSNDFGDPVAAPQRLWPIQ
jgi:hypothetical protein